MSGCRLAASWVPAAMAAVLALGCGGQQVKQTAVANPYARPELEFRGIGFDKQSFSGGEVIFKFALVSRDERPATASACPYKLEIKGGETLRGTVSKAAELPPRGELPVQVRIALPFPTEREELLAFLQRKRLPYKFSLTCELDTPSGPQSAVNTDAGSIPLPKLPQMDVLQANAERFGRGDSARVNFELNLLNENPFPVKLDKIAYQVFLDDVQVTQGDMVMAEVIPASSAFEYDVTTPIFDKQEHKEVLELLNRPQVEYRLTGKIQLGEFELPMDARGTISFTRAQEEE